MLIVDINAKFHNKEDDCFPKEQIFRKPTATSLSKGTEEISRGSVHVTYRKLGRATSHYGTLKQRPWKE